MCMEVHHQWCLYLMTPNMCTPVRCVGRCNCDDYMFTSHACFQNLQSLVEDDAEKHEVSCILTVYTTRDRSQFATYSPAEGEGYIVSKLTLTEVEG